MSEKDFLRCLLADKQNLSFVTIKKVQPHLFIAEKEAPFNTTKNLFIVLLKYFSKYHDVPSEEIIAKVLETSPYTLEQQKQLLTLFAELKLLPATTATIPFLLDELKSAYAGSILRQAVRESLDSLERNDIERTVGALKKHLFKLDLDTQDEVSEGTISASGTDRIKAYQQRKENPNAFVGIPTGYPTYDQCTGGLKPGELHIIASKSSEGKSTLLLNMGYNIQTKADKNVLYVSIEMPKSQLEGRYDALDANISYNKLKFGNLTDEEEKRYIEAVERQKAYKGVFYIYDISGTCTPSLLSAKIQELAAVHRFDVIIIDYLNIVQPDQASNSLWEDQGKIADQIRKIARSMRIPILTAVQVNREGMKGKADKYEQQHIALSQFIVNHSDAILSIKVADPAALEISDVLELNCWFIKNRDGARKAFKLIAAFDRFSMAEPTLQVG